MQTEKQNIELEILFEKNKKRDIRSNEKFRANNLAHKLS